MRSFMVHNGFASLPDHRLDDTEIPVSDALMSAFAMFSLKAPSLLAFDKAQAEGNLHTIYGIARVPGDMRMREILAHDAGVLGGPIPAAVLRRVPGGVGEAGQQAILWERMRALLYD